jgi:RNase P/RNase MRP subunit p30|tara:strand:+ start:528 stop:1028 length:501 start_codon:yes stop_codon:yes gene_type:complete
MNQLVLKQDKEFEEKLSIKTEVIKIIDVPLNKLRNEILKEKNLVVVRAGNDEFNRKVVENKKVDILLSPELNKKQDSLHYRKSGLNQVLCKLAKENDMAIGFDFSLLLNSKERGKILGRMMFNYKICKKYNVKMVFSSFAKNKFELRNDDSLRVFERILEKYSKDL